MRILHTNFLRGWGGQSNRILNLCRGLARRGHDVLIAAPEQSELLERARATGLATDGTMQFVRGFRPTSLVRDLRRMRGLISRGDFDLIHTHGSQDSWIVALADLRRRVPVVRTKHNIFPIRDHFANRWLYGRVFSRIICISTAIMEQCGSKPYIAPEKLALVHSAIELERFANPDKHGCRVWRERFAGHRPVVAAVGRLRPEKGHRFLLEAVAKLRGDFPKILLVIVGDGSLRPDLEQQACELGLADKHVRFLGFRDDVAEILAACDMFALASVAEGLGTAAIEAAAAGKPIVASRVGGLVDIVRDKETGRLVSPGDAGDLARAIAELAADAALAERLGRRAREFAFRNFTLEALVEKTEAVYAELLAGVGRVRDGHGAKRPRG